jgi:nitrite reductase/ring-hydroxylating ferredoxin subunit
MTMKRGRGSFREEDGGGKQNFQSVSGDVGSSSSSKRWVPVAGLKSAKDLSTIEQGKVTLVDTMAPALMDRGTNPTGAVSVIRYEQNTYCASSSCASCKIPLTKAKVLEPTDETGNDPRLACDFCSATYNLRTGERVTNVQPSGILGGIAKVLLSAQESAPLPVYELGEAKGKVVINLG